MSRLHNYTEENLVKDLQADSREAFEYLYEHYSRALYGVIFRIVKDDEIAEDLLQEVFVKIHQNLASYSPKKGRIYTWMLNVARNAAIDKIRSKSYGKKMKTQSMENSVHAVSQSHQVETFVDHIGLEAELKKLTDHQRFLIRKIYFEGYTQADLAEELDIPLGTVKTRIRKAILDLRKKLL